MNWRYRFGLRVNDPLPAEQLLQTLEGEALPPDKIPHIRAETAAWLMAQDDWSAGILRLAPLLIIYNPQHSAARHQSNMMHELAHVLLAHTMVGFSPATGLPLRNPRHEDEATYLGGCLQIPRLGLEWAVKSGYDRARIALHFGASEDMVRFRGNMTGLKVQSAD